MTIWSRVDRRAADGFTMIELLVAATMMVIITGATVSLLISTFKDQSRVTSRADQVGAARVALNKMVGEIRQGSAISAGSAEELKMTTYVHATSCTAGPSVSAPAISCAVTYKCLAETGKSTFKCTRKVSTAGEEKLVGGLSSKSVFTYSPASPTTSATYITVKLALADSSSASYTTTLENGAALRNTATNLAY
jgi:type II secretory pathway pseudopilin PulG